MPDYQVPSDGANNVIGITESGISSMTLWIDGEEIVTGNIAALKAAFANGVNPNFRETGDVGVFRLINIGTLDHQVKITSPQDLSSVVVDGNGAVQYLNNAIYIYFKGTTVEDVPELGQIGSIDVSGEGWTIIEFGAMNAINPTYQIDSPSVGLITVSTHAMFVGQSPQNLNGAVTITGKPTLGNLAFNEQSGYHTFITADGANPTSPVLSGSNTYNSPISVLFDKDVYAVSVDGGHFNNAASTYLEFYDRMGNILGRAMNSGLGIETFGYSMGGEAIIAGFSFYINELEEGGFAIDNLRFK